MIHPSGHRLRPALVLCAALACCGAVPAFAQAVVKCLDAQGNVTYQNSPCEKGASVRPMELPKAENRDDSSAWATAAQDGQVLRNMPKRWVLRARGAPVEIRRGTPAENANEVWRYGPGAGGRGVVVGFVGDNVAWVRDEGSTPPPAAVPAAKAVSPAEASPEITTRGPQNRRFVMAGRYCEHVFAEIGMADRQEALPSAGGGAAGVRYYYDPAPGDATMRTVFTCIDNKVADVERTLVP